MRQLPYLTEGETKKAISRRLEFLLTKKLTCVICLHAINVRDMKRACRL